MELSIFALLFLMGSSAIVGGIIAATVAVLHARVKTQRRILGLEKELEIARKTIFLQETAAQNEREKVRQMEHTFEALSSRILKSSSESYMRQTREQMGGFITPLLTNLRELEKHIHNVEKDRVGAYTQLYAEVRNLQKTNQELQLSTETLHGALKADTATRGKWGEIQLRRIVEMAGMVSHIDFEEQVHTKTIYAAVRPDMVIRMPRGGVVPVDAKVPMNAYLKACEANERGQRQRYLDAHKNALNKHIRDLSSKSYFDQFETSPSLVILFVPYESGLEASFTVDPTLLDSALEKKVLVAGPSTLYAFLKVISYGWMQVELSKNAQHIAKVSKELVRRMEIVMSHFSDTGKKLGAAVDSYNKSTRAIEARLTPKMNEVKTLRGDELPLPTERENPLYIETQPR